jgi:hypothetical protein
MADINLLGSEQKQTRSAVVLVTAVVWLLAALLIASLIGYVVVLVGIRNTNAQQVAKNQALEQAKDRIVQNQSRAELLTRQGQLRSLSSLLQNHLQWSKLLPALAEVTLKGAGYTNIEADTTGKLSVAVSLPSYAAVDQFLQIFDLPENQHFSSVKVLSITQIETETVPEIVVKLQLTFDPKFLLPSNK